MTTSIIWSRSSWCRYGFNSDCSSCRITSCIYTTTTALTSSTRSAFNSSTTTTGMATILKLKLHQLLKLQKIQLQQLVVWKQILVEENDSVVMGVVVGVAVDAVIVVRRQLWRQQLLQPQQQFVVMKSKVLVL